MKKGIIIFLVLVLTILVSSYVIKGNGNKKMEDREEPNLIESKEKKILVDEFDAEEVVVREILHKKDLPQGYFRNPLDGEIRLSGTFGELRSNHFHAGLDMRTGGVQGKPIYAAADGYVSRIKVSTYGYGKALYLRHPNGYTTVYGHLKKYYGAIAKYVEDAQYSQKKFGVHLFPKSDVLKVKKGEVIAYSGNSGGSGGPHLHFEIRSTTTEATINPLLFGLDIKDTRKPKIKKVFLHFLSEGHKRDNGYYSYRRFDELKPIANKTIEVDEGTYGIAAELEDEFLSGLEKLGVNYMKLFVDGVEVFDTKIEQLLFQDTRYMNCHIDFSIHKDKNLKVTKFWKDHGNQLKFYKHLNNGKVSVQSGETKKIKIWVKDLVGHETEVNFSIKGRAIIAESVYEVLPNTVLCYTHKENIVKGVEYECVIPKNSLYDDYNMPVAVKPGGEYSNEITFGSYAVPMHKKMQAKIKVKNIPKNKERKAYVVESFKGRKYPVSCFISNGYAKFTTKDFGTYSVALDTVAPKIRVLSAAGNATYKFYLTDIGGAGINKIQPTIDGKWFLMDWDSKTGMLKGRPREKWNKGSHKLKLKVTDDCDNTAIFEKTILIK